MSAGNGSGPYTKLIDRVEKSVFRTYQRINFSHADCCKLLAMMSMTNMKEQAKRFDALVKEEEVGHDTNA